MNKIVIDNDLYNLDSYEGYIVIKKNKTQLNITGKNSIFLEDNGLEVNITLLDDASVSIYMYNTNKKVGSNIVITQMNNTEINVYDLFESRIDIKETIIDNINGDNNTSNMIINIIQNGGNSEITEEIKAEKETKNNNATEVLKGLVCKGSIKTLPNMEINTNNIIANHYVTISSYDKDDLFYLMSKGISLSKAKSLIKKGYLFRGIDKRIRDVLENE